MENDNKNDSMVVLGAGERLVVVLDAGFCVFCSLSLSVLYSLVAYGVSRLFS